MLVSEVLMGCAAGIALAIAGYSLTDRLKKVFFARNQKKQRMRIVQNTLHAALAQRSVVRLEVMQGDFKGFSAEGIFNAVSQEHLIIQITDAFGAHQWTDVPLILFFSIQQNKKTSFFHFTTKAAKAVRRSSFTELYLLLPESVSPGQKRAFLRYTPPKTAVFGLGLWPMTGNTALPTMRTSLGKPLFIFRPQAHNDMVLDNISAGGLRVFVHERAMAHASHLLEKEAHVLFLLVLANTKNKEAERKAAQAAQQAGSQGAGQTPAHAAVPSPADTPVQPKDEQQENQGSTLSFWISCRVAMRHHVEKNNLWQIAVRFENWAHVDEKSKKILWFPTDSNKSIPPLSTWIMRSHMEQTKKI